MSRNPPPAQNANNGRNEYIPQYISAKPFYAEDLLKDTEYLSHQRAKAEQKDTIDKAKWYSRGNKVGPAATKYRKGACENCGAMTHKTKECLSRPRKQGARWTGRDIQADEMVEEVQLGYDAKRDRWNGYDVREYDAVVKDYEDMEALRKEAASQSAAHGGDVAEQPDADADADAEGDGDHYAEETDMGRNQPTSTRQLRLREDTAKYLLDLNPESATYDPKTRSMDTTAQNLNAASTGSGDVASEGFVRPSHDADSDAAAFERAQRFAWDSQDKPITPHAPVPAAGIGTESGNRRVHLEANPTASALAHKKNVEAQEAKKTQQRQYLLSKYGDSAASTASRPLAASSTSVYATYDPDTGRPIDQTTGKPMLKPVARSKYPEDVFPGNHTSVFGSYWRDGHWGYQCCHSLVRNSYCTGEEGKEGFAAEEAQRSGRNLTADGQGGEYENDKDDVMASESRKRKLGDEEGVGGDGEKRTKTDGLS